MRWRRELLIIEKHASESLGMGGTADKAGLMDSINVTEKTQIGDDERLKTVTFF